MAISCVGLFRFIPAPAGNGILTPAPKFGPAVYPRACGERNQVAQLRPAGAGLSPRLRGTVDVAQGVVVAPRFIPAPAGNGASMLPALLAFAVYPRACGERLTTAGESRAGGGLSPRLRGTVQHVISDVRHHRFIPAPAGNGSPNAISCKCSTVYPRACGERGVDCVSHVVFLGLSPRLRGTDLLQSINVMVMRFIPAPAGNGHCEKVSYGCGAVYPRACGERTGLVILPHRVFGLSPRLRGTGSASGVGNNRVRFIPAPAGNGSYDGHRSMTTPVYPRACGERSTR